MLLYFNCRYVCFGVYFDLSCLQGHHESQIWQSALILPLPLSENKQKHCSNNTEGKQEGFIFISFAHDFRMLDNVLFLKQSDELLYKWG